MNSPCPVCEFDGYDMVIRTIDGTDYDVKEMCVVCAGTNIAPIQTGVAAVRRVARLDRIIKRQQRRDSVKAKNVPF